MHPNLDDDLSASIVRLGGGTVRPWYGSARAHTIDWGEKADFSRCTAIVLTGRRLGGWS